MTRSRRKKAHKLTDKEVVRRLFPKKVREELKKDAEKIPPLFPKPSRKRKP